MADVDDPGTFHGQLIAEIENETKIESVAYLREQLRGAEVLNLKSQRTVVSVGVLIVGLLAIAGRARAAAPVVAEKGEAIFAGGCFWCMETAFEGRTGVKEVISGFDGGHVDHPSYEQVSTGTTGHAESVHVFYDPSKTTYAQLLNIFWHDIDPTSFDGQFCDRGSQYRPAIFYLDDAQQQAAWASKRQVEAELGHSVHVEIAKAGPFWAAEEYHQDFYKKNPSHYERYREGCGRDAKLDEIWGKKARKP